MHMSDALVSPPVFAVTGAVSLALLRAAIWKVKHTGSNSREPDGQNEHIVPLMGVMGAFIFAAQMINFSIPGTGSSGHLVGGILLSAILGPWAARITLASVLVLQCLVFADGGFMALGANILNMAVLSCLVAYPLLFRPLMKRNASPGRILAASMIASVVGLELGALAVTIETEASGITALPMGQFLLFMLPIHLFIGVGEGLATAAVIYVVQKYKPELLYGVRRERTPGKRRFGKVLAAISLAALLIGGSFSWIASSDPDGLEWSLFGNSDAGYTQNMGLDEDSYGVQSSAADKAGTVQEKTAFLPDYSFAGSDSAAGTSVSGIAGAAIVAAAAALICGVGGICRHKKNHSQ